VLFERLFLTAFAVVARIGTVFADKGYDAEANRELCRAFGAEPQLHKRGRPRGSGLGKRRWPVERSNAWLLENKRTSGSRCVTTGSASSCNRCSRPPVSSWLQDASHANCDNRLLGSAACGGPVKTFAGWYYDPVWPTNVLRWSSTL
jgi:hypothetical protein